MPNLDALYNLSQKSGPLTDANSTVTLNLVPGQYDVAIAFDDQTSFSGDIGCKVINAKGVEELRTVWGGNGWIGLVTFPNGLGASEPGVTFTPLVHPGDKSITVYVDSYTSGDVNLTITAGPGYNPIAYQLAVGLDGGNPAGTASESPGSLSIGGKDSTSATIHRTLSVDKGGRVFTRPWGTAPWAQGSAPGVNTQATTTKAAGGAGVCHVCTGLQATFVAGTSAPSAADLAVFLRDGASGSGTVLGAWYLALTATAGAASPNICLTNLNIKGSANTAMCLEFTGAGGSNTFEGLSLQGHDVTE